MRQATCPTAAAAAEGSDYSRKDKSLALLTENFMRYCARTVGAAVTSALAAGRPLKENLAYVELDTAAQMLGEFMCSVIMIGRADAK